MFKAGGNALPLLLETLSPHPAAPPHPVSAGSHLHRTFLVRRSGPVHTLAPPHPTPAKVPHLHRTVHLLGEALAPQVGRVVAAGKVPHVRVHCLSMGGQKQAVVRQVGGERGKRRWQQLSSSTCVRLRQRPQCCSPRAPPCRPCMHLGSPRACPGRRGRCRRPPWGQCQAARTAPQRPLRHHGGGRSGAGGSRQDSSKSQGTQIASCRRWPVAKELPAARQRMRCSSPSYGTPRRPISQAAPPSGLASSWATLPTTNLALRQWQAWQRAVSAVIGRRWRGEDLTNWAKGKHPSPAPPHTHKPCTPSPAALPHR